jgi:epoxyqueuosine reductase
MALASAIKQHGFDAGFDLVGIASPSALKDLEFLPEWLRKGYAGEMHYLADPRREDPRQVLPKVKSIICVGLIYNTPYPYSTDFAEGSGPPATAEHRRAWISRYAWGRDYHKVMREKLERLRTCVEGSGAGVETRVYVDTGPILERAFARLSGIGWMGKNTCLINEQKGSWLFLGIILTDLELDLDFPAPDRCGSCTRCLQACPTGALVEPYVMDASRCISYFNIELKGAIPEVFRKAMGRNVFGCDICQDVCPWNSRRVTVGHDAARDATSDTPFPETRAATTQAPEFQPLQVAANSNQQSWESTTEVEPDVPLPSQPFSLFNPPLEALASLSEEDFERLFANSPIKRAKYRGWLRNLCVAMGNSGDRRFLSWLQAAAENRDSVVREHATWALRQLQSAGTLS